MLGEKSKLQNSVCLMQLFCLNKKEREKRICGKCKNKYKYRK